jgi:hypothetical protein
MDGRNFWHGGRLTTDVSMPLPQMDQFGDLDCRYDTFRSMDTYYNGKTTSVDELRNSENGFPEVETNDVNLRKMYASKRMALGYLDTTPDMTKAEIAQRIASSMQNNNAIHYEFYISKNFAHAVGINRVRIWDNGKVLLNFMNPSGAGGYSTRNFNKMRYIFSIFKF